MEDKIEVLGIRMDCLTAKETMLQAMQFMENDPVDTIEIMTMDSLMNNQEDETWTARAKDTGNIFYVEDGASVSVAQGGSYGDKSDVP